MFEGILAEQFDWSGKAANLANLKSKIYKQQILFFHVPKCGGTSLSHSLRLRYAASNFRLKEEVSSAVANPEGGSVLDWWEFKSNLFRYKAHDGVHFVQGHVPYSEHRFATLHESAKFITILREPVERVISHYFYDARLNRMSFNEFLASPRGQLETSVYSRFFGELGFGDTDVASRESCDLAIKSLDKFDVVGILEAPMATKELIDSQLGIKMRIPKRNVGIERTQASFNADELANFRDRIRRMSRYDIEIYQAFCSRLTGKTSVGFQ